MPTDLQVVRAGEFIRLQAKGRIDFKTSRDLLHHVAEACRKRAADRVLIDLREIEYGPAPLISREELSELVDTFCETGFASPKFRLALLYSEDPHQRARLFAFLTTLHGGQVRACSDFEEALLWLSQSGDADAREPIPEHQHIPIRFLDDDSEPPSSSPSA